MTWRTLATLASTTLLASQVGTQILAYQTHYAAALGPPLATWHVFSRPHGLYAPWQGWQWAWQWAWTSPGAFRTAALATGLTFALGLLAGGSRGRQGRHGQPPPGEGHGTARWATRREMKAAGLLAPTGIVLGTIGRRILRFQGPENVLLVGPQRQGKGVGVIIPTLLDLPGHAVVIDIRGETYHATAGHRSTFSRCVRLALTQPGSARFNPLLEVRTNTPHEFMDAALLANMLVDPGQNKQTQDHWEKTAVALITCAVLYEVHTAQPPTLAHIASFWSQPGRSMEKTLQHIVDTAPLPVIAELAQEVLNKAMNEASGVLSSMMTQLFLFRDPTLAANTSASDFRLADFTRRDQRTSLYIVLSPGEEEHVRPFMRIFLRQALQRWMEISDTKHDITLLMDEFTSWGRMPFFVGNLAVLGGRGIRTLIAVQNVPQLTDTYGQADLITEQCKVRVYFAANGQTTGNEISRQAGTTTAITTQKSYRRSWYEVFDGSTNISDQHHARPLMTAGEAMQIPDDVAVIQMAGHHPMWVHKVRFYAHPHWQRLSQQAAPQRSVS